ncbi:MAG: Phosphoglucosamine mutase [Fibrobacteres bacterium]|nr:Phosphoglucosamine mutase [Fibrobacterota bacterium]
MRSVSGIRGIVGPAFSPSLIVNYVNAFIQLTGAKKVVIGRDTRSTGPMIENLVASACSASGAEAIMLGVASTPTVEMEVLECKAGGGIIITASHNPIEWNALKFLTHEGIFLDEPQVKALFELVDNNRFDWKDWSQVRSVSQREGSDERHIAAVLKLPFIQPDRIRAKKFRIGYDAVNGAGSLIVPKLLRALGCQVEAINVEPNGIFPHGAEPTPENLAQLEELVSRKKCHAGFATDPDADRCAIVNDLGKAMGEEYTLALATMLVLEHKKGPVAVNLSTSRMVDDIAARHGLSVLRTKVGEINVTVGMKANGSVIGGEGNGGVISPDLHYGRDGILAVAMTLQLMAEKGKPISAIAAEFPAYHIEKQKYGVAGKHLEVIIGRLLAKFPDAKVDQQDGIRFEWNRSWVHLRASNTEPVVRVIAEAPEREQAVKLCKAIEEELG